MGKKVIVKLGKDGSVKVEAEGFVGSSCEDATKFIDDIFGKPTDKKLKPEYYQEEQTICNGLPSGYCG